MKICFIQPEIPHYREAFFEKLSRDCNLTVYHSGPQEFGTTTRNYKNIKVKQLSIREKFLFQKLPITDILNHDIVIINGNIRYLSNITLLVLCASLRVKTIWWGHLKSANGSYFWMKLRLFVSRLATNILFYTEREALIAKAKYNHPTFKTHYMSNGLDLENIRRFRKDYTPEQRSIDVLFCGRFTKKSNIGGLIAAINSITTPLRVVLIGKSHNDQTAYTAHFKHHHNIEILDTKTDEEELSVYFNSAKLFVYPGSAGLSVIHAASYGVPVLIHDQWDKHMPEASIVRDYGSGQTYSLAEQDSLATMINTVLNDNEGLIRNSINGIQATEQLFNINSMVNNFWKVAMK